MCGTFAAQAALRDEDFYNFSLQKNREARKLIYDSLDAAGLRYLPSNTNFVFFQPGKPIAEVSRAFQEKGVLVGRPFPPMINHLRVSVGRPDEMERFMKAFKEIFPKKSASTVARG